MALPDGRANAMIRAYLSQDPGSEQAARHERKSNLPYLNARAAEVVDLLRKYEARKRGQMEVHRVVRTEHAAEHEHAQQQPTGVATDQSAMHTEDTQHTQHTQQQPITQSAMHTDHTDHTDHTQHTHHAQSASAFVAPAAQKNVLPRHDLSRDPSNTALATPQVDDMMHPHRKRGSPLITLAQRSQMLGVMSGAQIRPPSDGFLHHVPEGQHASNAYKWLRPNAQPHLQQLQQFGTSAFRQVGPNFGGARANELALQQPQQPQTQPPRRSQQIAACRPLKSVMNTSMDPPLHQHLPHHPHQSQDQPQQFETSTNMSSLRWGHTQQLSNKNQFCTQCGTAVWQTLHPIIRPCPCTTLMCPTCWRCARTITLMDGSAVWGLVSWSYLYNYDPSVMPGIYVGTTWNLTNMLKLKLLILSSRPNSCMHMAVVDSVEILRALRSQNITSAQPRGLRVWLYRRS